MIFQLIALSIGFIVGLTTGIFIWEWLDRKEEDEEEHHGPQRE